MNERADRESTWFNTGQENISDLLHKVSGALKIPPSQIELEVTTGMTSEALDGRVAEQLSTSGVSGWDTGASPSSNQDTYQTILLDEFLLYIIPYNEFRNGYNGIVTKNS